MLMKGGAGGKKLFVDEDGGFMSAIEYFLNEKLPILILSTGAFSYLRFCFLI